VVSNPSEDTREISSLATHGHSSVRHALNR
jgi:hypothetical protein